MEKLKNIIKYFLLKQQRSEQTYTELVRVGLFLYLVDWHSAVKQDKTITGIQWKVAKNAIQDSDEFDNAIKDETAFELGKDDAIPLLIKETIKIIDPNFDNNFTPEECDIFDRVIKIADDRNIIDLLIFALSTYPVISATDKLFNSDILGKAREYKQLKLNNK